MTDRPTSRRTVLGLGAGLVAGLLSGCGTDRGSTPAEGSTGEPVSTTAPDTDSGGDGEQTVDGDGGTATEGASGTAASPGSVTAQRVARGFTSPLGLEIPQFGRRFIVDQPGQVYLQDDTGVREEPYLDVADRMVSVSGYSEQGLLGLAFHPGFEENGRLFVRYSAPLRESMSDGYSHTFVLSEFQADPESVQADPDSERVLLEVPQPQANHNAGALAFGPDGYLYVATGDGGRADDQGRGHVDDWYNAVDGGNGQDVTENLLGSILRIDVDATADGREYAVPEDNPLVGEAGLGEQYAWGFRNPWRISFGPEGRLFVADVGQGAWEEVDVVEAGGNYGWNVREGQHCFRTEDCPVESPRGRPLRDPVIEYPHSGDGEVTGISVIGGYLYDGTDVPGLAGEYVFADWRAGGDLFAAREAADGLWSTRALSVEADAQFGPNVLSFGRNPAGELFVCTTAGSEVSGSSGTVFRLDSGE